MRGKCEFSRTIPNPSFSVIHSANHEYSTYTLSYFPFRILYTTSTHARWYVSFAGGYIFFVTLHNVNYFISVPIYKQNKVFLLFTLTQMVYASQNV